MRQQLRGVQGPWLQKPTWGDRPRQRERQGAAVAGMGRRGPRGRGGGQGGRDGGKNETGLKEG